MTSELPLKSRDSEVLRALSVADVRFIVIGGYAVRFHDPERDVDDLDILLKPEIANAQRLERALHGLALNAPPVDEMRKPARQWPLKALDYYIDFVTPPTDIDFDAAWRESDALILGGVRVRVAGIPLLLALKERSDREKDRADVERLQTCRRKATDRPGS